MREVEKERKRKENGVEKRGRDEEGEKEGESKRGT